MSATKILGIIFATIGGLTLLGVPVLQHLAASGDKVLVEVLGLAWLFGVWGTLVACMMFLIFWTGSAVAAHEDHPEAEADRPDLRVVPDDAGHVHRSAPAAEAFARAG